MNFLPLVKYVSVCASWLSEPFDPPKNVTFANVTASSVTLLWHPPTEPNGIIVHYTIYYSDNNTVAKQVRYIYCLYNTQESDGLMLHQSIINFFKNVLE